MRPLAIAYGNNRQAKVSIAVEESIQPVLSLSQTNQTATVTVAAKPQPVASSNVTSGASDTQVMITKTGECYHTHKCGNGTYFWVSFSEAQSRGLRPCQKCY